MKLGIDLGASKTQGVLLSEGNRKDYLKQKTDTEDTLEFLVSFAEKLAGGANLDSIGLSLAGVVDPETGEIFGAANLGTLPGLPVKEKLEEKFNTPVFLNNDGACFIWAEFLKGAARGYDSALGLTLGTGVGGGAVLNQGREPFLYRGAFGSGFEVGHMVIKADGAECGCGNKGCFETYASSYFFKRQSKYSPITLQEKAEQGDKKSKRIYRYYGHWLGIGLGNLVNLLDPEVIVLGGGLARAWELFIDQAREELEKHVLSPKSAQKVELKKAELGYQAPAIGAAQLDKIDTK